MKSKKLISLLCAAALSASAFAGLAIPASAAADPVWSYNGDSKAGWTEVGTMTTETDDNGDSYLQVTTQATKANGKILTLPAAAQLTDDYVIDFDVNLEAGDGMGRLGQYTQVAFTGDSPTADTQDYGGAYATAAQEAGTNPDTEHSWNTGSETGLGYQGKIAASLMSRTELQGKWVVNYAGAAPAVTDGDVMVGDNKWVRVRAAVSGGKANITIADGSKTLLTKEFAADATKLTSIYIASGRSDTQFFTSTKRSAIKLDNIAIYDGVANAPQFSTAGLRGYVAPTPEPAKVAAPVVKAPSSATVALDENFSKVDKMTVTQTDTKTTTAIGTGLDATMGGKEDGSSFVSVGDYVPGDKLMSVSGGRFTLAGRGPIISFKNTLASEYAANNTIVAAFAVNISKSSENGAGRLYFLKDTTQEGTDGNGAYRNIAAVLTTVQDEEIKRGETDVISTYVTPDEWHTVAFVLTGDKFRVYVDDAKEANVVGQYVATGGNASQLSELPIISTMSKAAKVNGEDQVSDYSFLRIDNIVTYSSTETSDLKKVLPTTEAAATPAPTEVPKHSVTIEQVQGNNQQVKVTSADTANDTFDGVLIHASYANGKLADVEAKDLKNISKTGVTATLTNTVAVGDKFYVWNDLKGMIPYGTATATAGVTKYTVTATADEGLDIEADKTSVEAGETVTLTVANTLTGVAFDGFETTGIEASAIQAGAEDGKYTFTMPAANVTIRAKATALVAPAAITKAAATNGSFTVKVGNEEVQTAAKGASVVITPTANQGYKVGNVKVEPTDSSVNLAVPVTNNNDGTYTFTMPEVAVTVTVTFVEDSAPAATPTTAPAATPTTAPAATPTTAPAATPTTAPVATPTAAPTPTPVPTYTVTITQPTGGTISVKNGNTDVTTGAEIAVGTEITVSATPDAAHKGGTITVTGADETAITVTNGKFTMPAQNVTIAVTFEEKTAVPFAAGTVTYEENGAAPLFTDFSRCTLTVADLSAAESGNKTKVENLYATGGSAGAKYVKYDAEYPATGDAVKVSFDFKEPTRNAWVSVRGNVATTADRNNNADKRIFTVGCESSAILKIYNGGELVSVPNTDALNKWYHVDATVNNTAKTFDIKVYDYSEYNDYEELTPLYTGTALAFRDNTVAGVVGMDYHTATNNGTIQLDNVYINDPSYVAPNTVTVTAPAAADGTLTASKSVYKTGDTVTLTATPKAGKKLTAIKVNGETVSTTSPYNYSPATAADITVTAEFARADVTTLEIAGDDTVSSTAGTKTYTATAKAGETTVDAAITWSVAAKTGSTLAADTSINAQTGVLTIDPAQTAGTVVITATTPVDVAEGTTSTEVKTATKEVEITTAAVYSVTKGAETNGTFTISAEQATTADTITVVPTPAAGYAIGEVSYTPAGGEKVVVTNNEGYKITGITANIAVNVTFTAIDYTITNSNATADASGNALTIKVGTGEAASTASVTAHVGDTITVVPVLADGSKLATLKYNDGTDHDILTAKSFTMPAGNVTVSATFEAWDGTYYSQDFSTAADNADTGRVDIPGGAWSTDKAIARQAISVLDNGSLKVYARDRNRSKGVYNLTAATDSASEDAVKLSFDWKTVVNCSRTDKSVVNEITFANSDGNSLFAIRDAISSSTRSGIQFYATGTANAGTSSSYGSNGFSGTKVNIKTTDDANIVPTGTAASAVWYHVEAIITNTAINVTLYDANGENVLGTGTMDITGTNLKKDLASIHLFIDVGSGNTVAADGADDFMNIDNIKLEKYTAPVTP